MNCEEFAALEDFKGSNGEGFPSFELGCVKLNGECWFSDCFYHLGIVEEDFEEVKAVLLNFYLAYADKQRTA